ncbi:MAG TPA: DUF177 domain-containing protein [Firmicutes bacterium]|nr:DUF177 domain-containing protein [Candidatus Fermentithermobacillaceae bacterium]
MKIDVTEILKTPGEGMSFQVGGEVPIPETMDGAQAVGSFVVRGVATSTGLGVYVDAHAVGTVELTCSRCLGSFTKEMELDCEAEFVEDPDGRPQEEEPEVSVFALEGGVCDLGEMVRHEVLLNLPMKPLCSEDCKGLCPVCGKNLNEGDCDCEKTGFGVTAFGRKLLDALNETERGKKNGRS